MRWSKYSAYIVRVVKFLRCDHSFQKCRVPYAFGCLGGSKLRIDVNYAFPYKMKKRASGFGDTLPTTNVFSDGLDQRKVKAAPRPFSDLQGHAIDLLF